MTGTIAQPEGITNPPIDYLLEQVDSKYALVSMAANRARQINTYKQQLEDAGALEAVQPMVDYAPNEKPLSIAMREIAAGMLEVEHVDATAEEETPDESFLAPFSEL